MRTLAILLFAILSSSAIACDLRMNAIGAPEGDGSLYHLTVTNSGPFCHGAVAAGLGFTVDGISDFREVALVAGETRMFVLRSPERRCVDVQFLQPGAPRETFNKRRFCIE